MFYSNLQIYLEVRIYNTYRKRRDGDGYGDGYGYGYGNGNGYGYRTGNIHGDGYGIKDEKISPYKLLI
jgi:hypothetical protein